MLTAHPAGAGEGAAVVERLLDDAEAAAICPTVPAVAPAAGDDSRERLGGVLRALLARMRFLEDERARNARTLGLLEGQASRLQGEVNTHLGHIEFLREALAQRDARIGELAGRVSALEARITEVTSGVGWALLQRYRGVRRRLCPPGSARERAYVACLRGFQAVVRRRPRFG